MPSVKHVKEREPQDDQKPVPLEYMAPQASSSSHLTRLILFLAVGVLVEWGLYALAHTPYRPPQDTSPLLGEVERSVVLFMTMVVGACWMVGFAWLVLMLWHRFAVRFWSGARARRSTVDH